jgi:molybdopterin synthase catalytic subunit
VLLPPSGDDWVGLSADALDLGRLANWAVLPNCGAVVVFAGTVRDHAEGRPGVVSLEYEAYAAVALDKMEAITREVRRRWPFVGRVALVHRTGLLVPSEVSVLVSVSAPHRPEAFDAARFGIDAIKAGVPIWKRETWAGGSAWGLDAHPVDGSGVPHLSEDHHVSQLGS